MRIVIVEGELQFKLEVDQKSLVKNVKSAIAAAQKVPALKQRLFFSDKKLADGEKSPLFVFPSFYITFPTLSPNLQPHLCVCDEEVVKEFHLVSKLNLILCLFLYFCFAWRAKVHVLMGGWGVILF